MLNAKKKKSGGLNTNGKGKKTFKEDQTEFINVVSDFLLLDGL